MSIEMTTSVGQVPREARRGRAPPPPITHLLERTQIFGLKIGYQPCIESAHGMSGPSKKPYFSWPDICVVGPYMNGTYYRWRNRTTK